MSLSAGWLNEIQRAAVSHPDRVAIRCGNYSLDYQTLISSSNRLATRLQSLGIGKGDFVGVSLHREARLPGVLLAILRTGAAYIPLDPSYPAARIEQMTQSAKLKHVITSSDHRQHFAGANIILLEEDLPYEEGPSVPLVLDDFIYAIFTSGSTGQPKAATVYHKGFANLLEWYSRELSLGQNDSTLIISSPSFDLTQKNFFAPLMTGGTLVLDDEETYDITRITRLIREHRITVINCTPSAFYPLVDAAASTGHKDLESLRFVILGGEPISIPRLRAWLENPACHAEIINSYGPTECTDICAFHRLHRGNLDVHPFVPLGQEIPNVSVTIRDEEFTPVPDGELGELCISGIGVGGGYLNDFKKTDNAFRSGTYRTGDLARRLPDGLLEFRGRADYQVKLNGFRIELGEIEIALSTHGAVREAVVVATSDQLVAHIQGEADAQSLKDHLAARLPSYMIPSVFRFVESFALTPNGKIDRKALSDKVISSDKLETSSPASVESRILKLWSEVLGQSVSDPDANFFDLGGNSIHLAVLHVKLVEMHGTSFSITELFALPTARSIAAFLSKNSSGATPATVQDRARMAKAGFSRFRPPVRK